MLSRACAYLGASIHEFSVRVALGARTSVGQAIPSFANGLLTEMNGQLRSVFHVRPLLKAVYAGSATGAAVLMTVTRARGRGSDFAHSDEWGNRYTQTTRKGMRDLTHQDALTIASALRDHDAATGNQARGLWWTVRRASRLTHPPRNSWRVDLSDYVAPFLVDLRGVIRTLPNFEFVGSDDESLGKVVDALIMVVREEHDQLRTKQRTFSPDEIAMAVEMFKATEPGIWEKLKICQSRDAGGYGTPEYAEVRRSMARVELTLNIFTEAERRSLAPSTLLGKIVEVARGELRSGLTDNGKPETK
jgi:hypothetical protein